MPKVNHEYEHFKKKFAEETGLIATDERIPMLMSKLKRAEGKLRKLFLQECKEGRSDEREAIENELMLHVEHLMAKYKTIKVRFNSDPRGGAIRFIFTKTGWVTTLGSDVAVDW